VFALLTVSSFAKTVVPHPWSSHPLQLHQHRAFECLPGNLELVPVKYTHLLSVLHIWETSAPKLIMRRRMPDGAADAAGTTGLVRQKP
jgi:hypothetical protein